MKERTSSLNERLRWLASNSNKLDGVSLEKGKLSLARLEKDVSEEAKKFSASLYQMLPRIKLTDLLMDVAHITGFHEQFTHASNNRKPDKEETTIIMAALLGMGTNIGLSKMAEATPELTYKQLANVSQWRMYEDAMNKAQAVLVNFHHKLQLLFLLGRRYNILVRWYENAAMCFVTTCRFKRTLRNWKRSHHLSIYE